ncbi:hypothetical protein GCM10007385_28750 [Tateyamaria omphalii]|uniref:hypothetical protein n=1 Tax=Tateyamaria omphalii TaxID=299262 RepID=UPI00167306E8|nr:hypothetical protein [Tateyamaria omphalii]GGX58316.1 hypothetical protein GCM10007385_28750 [Tateyamaria omphalii]
MKKKIVFLVLAVAALIIAFALQAPWLAWLPSIALVLLALVFLGGDAPADKTGRQKMSDGSGPGAQGW